MIVDSHRRGPRKSRIKLKKDAKDIGIKRKMSQEEFDKEIVQIKEKRSELIDLLQEGEDYQRQGWILRKKKVKWPILQEKMDQRLLAWWNKVLKETEYAKKVPICEHEQGSILGEEEDIDE